MLICVSVYELFHMYMCYQRCAKKCCESVCQVGEYECGLCLLWTRMMSIVDMICGNIWDVCTRYVCPVNGECEKKAIIYQYTVKETLSQNSETYVGLSERSFKDRITKHRKSFRDRYYHRAFHLPEILHLNPL